VKRRVYTFNPVERGGHAKLTHAHLSALRAVATAKQIEVGLITARGLAPEFRDGGYPIFDFLTPLVPRSELRNPLSFVVTRLREHLARRAQFLGWVRRERPVEVVHVEQTYPEWLAWRDFALLRRFGARLVYTVHNVRPHRYPAGVPRMLFDRWNRTAWMLCDALIVLDQSIRAELREFMGPRCPPIAVVPLGLYTGIQGRSPKMPEARNRLLFFGKIRRNKGLHLLIEAVARMPRIQLTIAGAFDEGDPAYKRTIKGLLAQIQDGRVILLDRHIEDTERDQLFADTALVVLPYTDFASQSGVLFDAIGYHRPVVASDVGALGTTVRELGLGELVRPESVEGLMAAVTKLQDKGAYSAALERVTKAHAERSMDAMARATIFVYEAVLDGRQMSAAGSG
jgi:glycosyltransferase involved in cell wall biosynthesis